jgi:hypothetical protein
MSSSDYDQWMKLGNEYYAKGDTKSARECWSMAEKSRQPSEADRYMYRKALAEALRRNDF